MIFTKSAIVTNRSETIAQELKTHKAKYIFHGIIFIILGVLAGSLPVATALSAELLIGVVLLISGIFQMALTLKSRIHWWSLLSACLSMLIGIIMIWRPLAGLMAVVTLLAIFMTIEGIFELFLGSFDFQVGKKKC